MYHENPPVTGGFSWYTKVTTILRLGTATAELVRRAQIISGYRICRGTIRGTGAASCCLCFRSTYFSTSKMMCSFSSGRRSGHAASIDCNAGSFFLVVVTRPNFRFICSVTSISSMASKSRASTRQISRRRSFEGGLSPLSMPRIVSYTTSTSAASCFDESGTFLIRVQIASESGVVGLISGGTEYYCRHTNNFVVYNNILWLFTTNPYGWCSKKGNVLV